MPDTEFKAITKDEGVKKRILVPAPATSQVGDTVATGAGSSSGDDQPTAIRVVEPGVEMDVEMKNGTVVTCNYVGRVAETGVEFDRSLAGYAFKFTIGKSAVILGWEIGVQSMKIGEKAEIWIRSDYGYGDQGSGSDVPPNSDLIFEVELLSVSQVEGAKAQQRSDLARLEEIKRTREEAKQRKAAEDEKKTAMKADAQAILREKLANKHKKGKTGKVKKAKEKQ